MTRAIVSGASGWLGKSALHVLQDVKFSQSEIVALSSSRSRITVESSSHDCLEASQLRPSSEAEVYIHTAFVTREHFQALGESKYVEINKAIIASLIRNLELVSPRSIVFVSSGVCTDERFLLNRDRSFMVYRDLKLHEADTIRKAAEKLNATVVEGVLFSATGRYMKSPTSFAIGDIIQQAIKGSVQLSSTSFVWRKYCDAVQFMRVLIQNALDEKSLRIESGGPLQEMEELARNCLMHLGLEREILRSQNFDFESRPDLYFSKTNDYEAQLNDLEQTPLNIFEQISNVTVAMQRSVSREFN